MLGAGRRDGVVWVGGFTWSRSFRLALCGAVALALVSASAFVPSGPRAEAAGYFDEQVLFERGAFGYECFRIPAVVRAANGDVLAFAEGRVNDCGDDGDIDLVLRRSTDGGETFGPLQVVSAGEGSTHGNPVPVVDRNTGRVVLVSTHNGPDPCQDGCDRDPYVQHSDDDGATWSAPREMTEGKLPEWNHWYATGPMHGIQLQRGAHAGRLVVGANFESYDDATGEHVHGSHLLYSDDAGETWHVGAKASRDDGRVIAQEVTVVELTDGRVYALARERGTDPGNRAYATSSDGGETFDRRFRTLPDLVTPDVQGSLLRFSASGDRGGARDRILFSAPAHDAAREVMTIRSSYDEAGTFDTWERGKVVHWGPSAYSDMVRLSGDRAALLYEAGEGDPYETIRLARFDSAYLATPNGEPPGIPDPPEPGPTTPDVSGQSNPAYVRGGVAVEAGRFGSALALDGVDDRVEVPFDESVDLADKEFTLAAWVRYTATTGRHAVLWAYRVGTGTTPQVWLRAEPASNRVRALMVVDRFTVTVQSTTAYNDGDWHHVALRRTGGRLELLVDGTEVSAADAPPGSLTAGKQFGVGGIHVGQRLDGADRYHGSVDEIRVYRRALRDDELTALRTDNAPLPGRLGLRLPSDSVG